MVDIAQSVERRVVVADVAGSNPVIHPREELALASLERPMHARETAGSTPRPLARRCRRSASYTRSERSAFTRRKSMMEAYGSGP